MTTFKHAPFNAIPQLVAAAKNKPALRTGAHGPGVRLLQGALLDLGYRLPRSTQKTGSPDGVFGGETERAVKAFQGAEKLTQDGVAGRDALLRLDVIVSGGKKHLNPPNPKKVYPGIKDKHYQFGNIDPPIRNRDKGAGPWKSRPWKYTYVALRDSILEGLPVAVVTIGDDAVKHLRHYFGGSGTDYAIDLEGMISEVPSAGVRFEEEVRQAKAFVERLQPGSYEITSTKTQGDYNLPSENRNWFFATGGYESWGKGYAKVTDASGKRQYNLEFEYRMFDRYNWDGGKKVTIPLVQIDVTDEFMGEFHRQGLAQEFNQVGSVKRQFSWSK